MTASGHYPKRTKVVFQARRLLKLAREGGLPARGVPATTAPTSLRGAGEGDGTEHWVSPTGARAQTPPRVDSVGTSKQVEQRTRKVIDLPCVASDQPELTGGARRGDLLSPPGLLGNRGINISSHRRPDHTGSDRRVAGGRLRTSMRHCRGADSADHSADGPRFRNLQNFGTRPCLYGGRLGNWRPAAAKRLRTSNRCWLDSSTWAAAPSDPPFASPQCEKEDQPWVERGQLYASSSTTVSGSRSGGRG